MPLSTLMPTMMPALRRISASGVPSSALWKSVSSKTMQPETYALSPAVVKSICR